MFWRSACGLGPVVALSYTYLPQVAHKRNFLGTIPYVDCDGKMRKAWPFVLRNDEQMSSWLGVDKNIDIYICIKIYIMYIYTGIIRYTKKAGKASQNKQGCFGCLNLRG